MHEASKSRKENILNQAFTVSAPNEVWVSDVTIFEYDYRKYYICVVLDLYARKAISHAIALSNSTQLTKRALINAYNERQPSIAPQRFYKAKRLSTEHQRFKIESLFKFRLFIKIYTYAL